MGAGRRALRYFTLAVALWISPLRGAVQKELAVDVWKGASLTADEGAFTMQSTIVDTTAKIRDAAFDFWLRSKSHGQIYHFHADKKSTEIIPLWNVRADTYELIKIRYEDENREEWTWQPVAPQLFHVEVGALSHFGSWYLVQVPKDKRLSFLMKAFHGSLLPHTSRSMFKRLIDGESGVELSGVKDKGPKAGALMPESVSHVGIDFRLDLFRQSSQVPIMTEVVLSREVELRSCFGEYLLRIQASVVN